MKKPKKHKPQQSSAPAPAKPSDVIPSAGSGSVASSSESGGTRVDVPEVGGEPVAGRAAVPVLLIALLAALMYFGDVYVVEHGGELDARVHQPFRTVRDLDDLQPKGEEALLKAKGLKVYTQFCVACHQGDGNGNPSTFIPPLAGSDWVSPKDPSRIIRVVLNGLTGPITVNNKPWGGTAMLSWRDSLNDDDVAAVLTYVRTSWGNKAPGVKAEDVKKIREETKGKKDGSGTWLPWTGEELQNLPLKE